jgi:hypothetical protein
MRELTWITQYLRVDTISKIGSKSIVEMPTCPTLWKLETLCPKSFLHLSIQKRLREINKKDRIYR